MARKFPERSKTGLLHQYGALHNGEIAPIYHTSDVDAVEAPSPDGHENDG